MFLFIVWTGESPVPSVSSGTSSPLSASTAAPTMIQAKNSSSSQDRKVPPPIGTERLARIRQTGSVNPALLNTNYTAPVGHGGIWSFGVGSASGRGHYVFCLCIIVEHFWIRFSLDRRGSIEACLCSLLALYFWRVMCSVWFLHIISNLISAEHTRSDAVFHLPLTMILVIHWGLVQPWLDS